MESKWVRVLDNGPRVVVHTKKRGAAQFAANISDVSHKLLSHRAKDSYSSFDKLGKRKRSTGSRTKCGLHLRNSLLKNYSKFKRSGLPQRLLHYQNGEWNDFSEDIVQLARENFQMQKPAIEMQLNGSHLMLDVLYMVLVDLKTGSSKPVAWIDDAGACFFPELYSTDCGTHECNRSEKDEDFVHGEPPEINLHLQIEVNGINSYDVEDCVEESNVCAKKMRLEEQPNVNTDELARDNYNKGSNRKLGEVVGEAQHKGKTLSPNLRDAFETVDLDYVRNMFSVGMNPSSDVNLIDMSRCSSVMMQNHWEIFQKQVEITQRYRGDANVQYAWLAASKEALPSLMTYGLAHFGLKSNGKYGNGIHLTSEKCSLTRLVAMLIFSVFNVQILLRKPLPFFFVWSEFRLPGSLLSLYIPEVLTLFSKYFDSANVCDVDENGVRYMVFCRIVLGNVELLHPGSGQFHPSSEEFDSGVDDLENPTHYIVWNMNLTTHIHPEYVVSFKLTNPAEEALIGNGSGVESTEGTPDRRFTIETEKNARPCPEVEEKSQGRVPSVGSSSSRTPRSPWMPFAVLFEAFSDKIAPNDMEMVNAHYDLFRSKKIIRVEFIRRLRAIVGDEVLRSTITGLRAKFPSNFQLSLKTPKEE